MSKLRPNLPLTTEMFADWREHPVTEALLWVLSRRRQERKDKWEEGAVLELQKDGQMLLNAAAIGECQAYKFVEEMEFEQLKTEIANDGE